MQPRLCVEMLAFSVPYLIPAAVYRAYDLLFCHSVSPGQFRRLAGYLLIEYLAKSLGKSAVVILASTSDGHRQMIQY